MILLYYLTDIDEIRLLQVHVELDQHPQHLIAELLVLHQGHADLQAVGQEAINIILHEKRKKEVTINYMFHDKEESRREGSQA